MSLFFPEHERSAIKSKISEDSWNHLILTSLNVKSDLTSHLTGGWSNENCKKIITKAGSLFWGRLAETPHNNWNPDWINTCWKLTLKEFVDSNCFGIPPDPKIEKEWPVECLEPEELRQQQSRRLFKQMLPYVIFFIIGVVILKFVFLWMLNKGWLYWDDGPGYR